MVLRRHTASITLQRLVEPRYGLVSGIVAYARSRDLNGDLTPHGEHHAAALLFLWPQAIGETHQHRGYRAYRPGINKTWPGSSSTCE
jgi:hypothetical protein